MRDSKSNLVRICQIMILLLLTGLGQLLADGFIIIEPPYPPPPRPRPTPEPPPSFDPFPLAVKNHYVTVTINEQTATTEIDQTFYNPTPNRLQGYYVFPIPPQSALDDFSMFIDGKEMEAEILDSGEARKIFEDIVRKARDPALLQYINQQAMRLRIFPIEPHSEKRIKMTYSQVLPQDNGTVEYLYPLNTEKFSAEPIDEVRVKVDVHSERSIKNAYCPTHQVDVHRRNDHHIVMGYEANNVKPNTDFKVYYDTDPSQIGLSLLTYRESGENGFFFLNLSPGFNTDQYKIAEKDITFVLDVSGSMAGIKLEQAKKAITFCVENLNQGDRFEIVRFSTQAEALFEKLVPFKSATKKQATKFIKNLKAIGGTNIEGALELALTPQNQSARPHFVVFITDGKPTIGETDEQKLLEKIQTVNQENLRIFTFGIGDEINTHLLDKITEQTRAYRTYVHPEEDIEVEISNFYTKVASPILTNLELSFSSPVNVSDIYPVKMPDLFKGSSLSLLGRYRGSGSTAIQLAGNLNREAKRFEYQAEFNKESEAYSFIPTLWASRAIGFMLDQIRLHGESEELKEEIVDLARTYGIITPYTSYLIVEDEEENIVRGTVPPEFAPFGNVAENRHFRKSIADDFRSLEAKSGEASVKASEEIQSLNMASSAQQIHQGQSRLYYQDNSGAKQNLANQYRLIQGRALYQAGNFWIDSKIQSSDTKTVKRIQFASEEYFELLQKEPKVAPFLALGKNMRFLWKDVIYEIYE